MERLVERKKASNEQLDMMIQLLSENEHLARGRIVGKKGHAKAWVQISNALNSYEFGAIKTPEKWLQTWRDLRCNTKKRAAKIQRGIGERNSLSELELKVLRLVDRDNSDSSPLDIPESTIQMDSDGKVWTELTTNSDQNNMCHNNANIIKQNGDLQCNKNSNMLSGIANRGLNQNDCEELPNLDCGSSEAGSHCNLAPKKRKIQKNTMVLNTLSAQTKRIISVGRLGGRVRTSGLEQEIMALEQEKLELQREHLDEMRRYHNARLQAENDKIHILQNILSTIKHHTSKIQNEMSAQQNQSEPNLADIACVMKNILTKEDVE